MQMLGPLWLYSLRPPTSMRNRSLNCLLRMERSCMELYYYSGKAYGRYSETIDAVASRRLVLKLQLVGAWDVADEPHSHHPAIPLLVILAFAALGMLWGWAAESALLLMSWVRLVKDWRGSSRHKRRFGSARRRSSRSLICIAPNPPVKSTWCCGEASGGSNRSTGCSPPFDCSFWEAE